MERARALATGPRVLLLGKPAQGLSPAVAARTYGLPAGLVACVFLAERRLPSAPRGRTVVVYEPRRGAVVFSGEAAGLRGR